METKKKLREIVLSGALIASALFGVSTLPGCIPEHEMVKLRTGIREGKSLIIPYGGLGDGLTQIEVKKMAERVDAVAPFTHGYHKEHAELVALANSLNRPVYIISHSKGEEDVANIQGRVKRVYNMDSYTSHYFPSGVQEGVDIHSSDFYIFGKKTHPGARFIEIPNSNHLNLPSKAMGLIEEEIRRDRERSATE